MDDFLIKVDVQDELHSTQKGKFVAFPGIN